MKKENSALNKGMVTESTGNQMPKGSWNMALNAMLGSWDGDITSITNEVGNEVCFQTGRNNFTLVGAQPITDNKFVLFFADDTDSIIGIHDALNCTFQELVRNKCPNFLLKHRHLKTKFRILNGCDRMLYWTDGVTSYKSMNIDSLDSYLALDNNGQPKFPLTTANADANYATAWDCKKFDHFPSYSPGCMDITAVTDAGGTNKAGAHVFVFRYLDESLNPTNWSLPTYPVFIYTEGTATPTIDGEAVGTVTNKAIKFDLKNLDPTFKFIQIGVASSVLGTQSVDEVFILDYFPIIVANGVGSGTYTFFGFNKTKHTIGSVDSITVPNIPLYGVKAHEIIDNRLLFGNISVQNEDFAVMQRAMLNARVKWRVYEDYELDPNGKNTTPDFLYASKNTLKITTGMTFMRDEIYALGGGFVFNNGQRTPGFHIPGRAANTWLGSELSALANANTRNKHITRGNTPIVNNWDTQDLQVITDGAMNNGDENTKVGYTNVTSLLDQLGTTASLVSLPDKVDATYTIAGNIFTLNFANPNDKATVRVTTIGINNNYSLDNRYTKMTNTNNTILFSQTDSRRTLMGIQIIYYIIFKFTFL